MVEFSQGKNLPAGHDNDDDDDDDDDGDNDDIDDVDDNDNDTFANLPSQMLGDQSLAKQQGLQGGTFSFFTLLQRIGWM